MDEPLTPRQRDILGVITNAVQRTGQAPALTAIGEQLGGITPPSVYKHILALEQKGYIRRHPNRRPPIELLLPSPTSPGSRLPALVRLAGYLRAGRPLVSVESGEDIAVERDLLGSSSRAVVALRIQGFGLTSEGLLDGDMLIVQTGSEAQPGATVVAVLDGGGATVRRYVPAAGLTILDSAQPGGEPLAVSQITIYGTVLAVRRRYGASEPRQD
ncbi:MAG TPA: transcriptional repressor LexA [Chloroflexota bacterium]|nr:transcriptional repressor LexA [Chloroflexota bacterium]